MAFKKPQIIKNKFVSTIVGSIATFFAVAFILPLNNFTVYLTSNIHIKQNFVTMHYGFFINLIFNFAMTFSSSLGGILETIIGFMGTIFFGMIIVLIGNILFIFQQNIWACYLLTLLVGIGAGITTSLIGKNLTLYAPNKKGIITGIIGLGTIILSAIFGILGEKMIVFNGYTLKEDEEYYPEDIAKNVYKIFLVGFITLPLGGILTSIFIYEFKPEYIESNNNSEDEKNEKGEKIINTEENKEQTFVNRENIWTAVKTFRFWKISIILLLVNFPISFMVNTGRTFGAIIGLEGNTLQFLIVFQAISLILLGPIIGILVDKKGPLVILKIVSFACIIPGILLPFFMTNIIVFVFSFIILILGLVGVLSSFVPFIMEVYGIQESVILGGIINAFSKLSEITTTVAAFIVSLIYTKEEIQIPYKYIYITGSICCVFCLLLLFTESTEKFKYEDNNNDKTLLDSKDENITN